MSSKKVATILVRFGALFIFISALSGFFEIFGDEIRERISNDLQRLASEINSVAENADDSTDDLIDTNSLEEYKRNWITNGIIFTIILSLVSIAIFYYSDQVAGIIAHGLPGTIDSTVISVLIIQVLSFSIFVEISFYIIAVIISGLFVEFFREAWVVTVMVYIFCLLLVIFSQYISRIFTWKIKDS